MPELPEVETVRRGLEPYILNRRIQRVVVRDRRLRWPIVRDFEQRLSGRKVKDTQRRSKYLILPLDNGDRLMIHLGMSGRLRVLPQGLAPQAHDHVDLQLDNDHLIRFHDPRRFGAMLLWEAELPTHPLLEKLGPEPFDPAFSGDYLYARSRGRSTAVKNFIMDGRIVVGAGNIYACEALFHAGIRPGAAAGRITRPRYRKLAETVREVLQRAIRQGGTTLRDFFGADGESGYFQQELFAYGREGKGCRVCGDLIRRKQIGQRSSFFCPHCQR